MGEQYMKDFSSEIFSIENDSRILDFITYDGVPIWMIARWYLLHDVIGGKIIGYKSPVRMRGISKDMIPCIFKSVFYNLTHRNNLKNKSIVFYSTNRKTIVDDRFFNRYVDDFYLQFKNDSCVIEQSLLNWEWPFPRTSENVYFDVFSRLVGEMKARIGNKKDKIAVNALVHYFIEKAKKKTNLEFSKEEINRFKGYICKLIIAMRYQAEWMNRQLGDQVKCLIMVGAAFPQYYFLNKRLKEKNIISIEIQHGYITETNIMYNYASAIKDDPRVKMGLPDHIFTYGRWWNDQFNCPIDKVAIGNPYRSRCLKHCVKKKTPKYITVMGVGENTKEYLDLINNVQERYNIKDIRFRPHPGEQATILQFPELANKILIDKNLDVYDSLAESKVIIGEVSTVLFEAVGIVDRILVWDTAYTRTYLPDHPFERFDSLEQLFDLVIKNKDNCNYQDADFWEEDWQQNYKEFIETFDTLH